MNALWMAPATVELLRQACLAPASTPGIQRSVVEGMAVYTDCAMAAQIVQNVPPFTRGLPHTCGGTCSRARQEAS